MVVRFRKSMRDMEIKIEEYIDSRNIRHSNGEEFDNMRFGNDYKPLFCFSRFVDPASKDR